MTDARAFRWAFAGCKPQGAGVLNTLCGAGFVADFCAAPPDLSPGDEQQITDVCREFGVPLHRSLRLQGFADRLRALDLLLVCRFEILPPDIFDAPRLGAINIHSSLLPKYQGVHPVSWALINGEAETGLTVHRIRSGVDTGEILAQRVVPIVDDDDLWTLTAKIDAATAETALSVFREVSGTGTLPPSRPQQGEASRAPRRTPADGHIDWRQPARRIFNLVRALPPPLPSAFCHDAEGRRVEVVRAWPVEGGPVDHAAGTVQLAAGQIRVTCGDGQLLAVETHAPLSAGDRLC